MILKRCSFAPTAGILPGTFLLVLAFSISIFAQDKGTAAAKGAPPPTAPQGTTAISKSSKGGGTDDRLIVNSDLITLTVTVTDNYGRYVSGLDQKAFSISDEKVPQEIQFFSDDDAPVSVGVIFDVSGSMSGDKIRRAREALGRFISTSHD